jgi:hypothetical protein
MQIVQVDACEAMRKATHMNDSRISPPAQQGKQLCGESKMTKIIRPELHLEAIRRHLTPGRRKHGGEIDEQIDRTLNSLDAPHKCFDDFEVGKVKPLETDKGRRGQPTNLLDRPTTLGLVRIGYNDIRAGSRKAERNLKAHSTYGASDYCQFSSLRRNVCCSPFWYRKSV